MVHVPDVCMHISIEWLLVEWEGEEGHSVVDGKVATLIDGSAFTTGAKVLCKIKEGDYTVTILCTGIIDFWALLN